MNPQADDWLFELYLRCDISNNRTENPITLNEFIEAIRKHIDDEIRTARIEEWNNFLDHLTMKAVYGDLSKDAYISNRLTELKKESDMDEDSSIYGHPSEALGDD